MKDRRKLINLGIAGVVALLAVIFHEQLLIGALMAAGRNPFCDFQRAMASLSVSKQQQEIKERILAATHLIEKDPAGFEQWETPLGPIWSPAGSVSEIMFDVSEQTRNIYDYDGHGVQKGDIVLDCGANVGVYTKVALKAGASKVVAIEPSPENLECLRRNLAKEIEEGKVIIYPKGVWDKDDLLTFYVNPKNSAGNSFVRKLPGSEAFEKKLPLTTIDKLVEELHLERVDFMKFDIEGAERRALRGARQTLAKYHPRMVVCVYHMPDDPVIIPQTVAEVAPSYKQECGRCIVANTSVVPEVFFFF